MLFYFRWEKAVTKGGTKSEKMKEIERRVKTRFDEVEENGGIVHDSDLRSWGFEVSNTTET